MLEDVPDLDVLVIPIGGGGLIAGNAIAARAKKPSIEIVGVECALYPSMWNAIHGGERPCGGATLAEGIAVAEAGKLTLPIVRDLVRDIILVDEPQIERAVNAFLTLQKTMAEGAGAAGLAAMLAEPERFAGRKVGLILCGGNIDPRILASIMVRELERDDRIASFRLTIPDRPGILGQIASRLGELGANILGVDHHRLFLDVPAKGAKLDVTVETRDGAHAEQIFRALDRRRLPAGAHGRRRRAGVMRPQTVHAPILRMIGMRERLLPRPGLQPETGASVWTARVALRRSIGRQRPRHAAMEPLIGCSMAMSSGAGAAAGSARQRRAGGDGVGGGIARWRSCAVVLLPPLPMPASGGALLLGRPAKPEPDDGAPLALATALWLARRRRRGRCRNGRGAAPLADAGPAMAGGGPTGIGGIGVAAGGVALAICCGAGEPASASADCG